MNYLIPALAAFILSIFLTLLVRKIAWRYRVIDQPGGRHIHQRPTAKLGGVAIFGSFLIIIIFYLLINRNIFDFITVKFAGIDKALFGLLLGALILVIIGAIDDVRPLPVWQKLLGQIAAALIVIGFGIGITYINSPFGGVIRLDRTIVPINLTGVTHNLVFWAAIFALAWILIMINVMNFLDGLDGLAGGISVIALIILFILSLSSKVNQSSTALLCIILAGAVLGFLIFNFYPAKIFMCDSGSMFLGFTLATIAIISGGKVATALLVLGLPILDALWVILRRIMAGQSPFVADSRHLHHRLLSAGLSVRQTVIIFYFFAAIFGILALQIESRGKFWALIWLIVLMLVLALGLVLIEWKKKSKKNARSA